MAISFNSNPGFVLEASASNSNRNFTENPLERLSSGKRNNSAADDAVGLALISKLEAALSEKEQAIRNAATGQGILQTADAGAAEVSNMLNRMRELAIRATNGTNSIAEREALQNEAELLTAEINRIANSTSFNGRTPLFGTETVPLARTTAEKRIITKSDGVSARDLQLDGGHISFLTSKSARNAIGVIDQALAKIVSVRGEIGANVGRISNNIDHLSTAKKNSTIKASQASNANHENERMRLTKSKMLQHASIAMLAQGNATKGVMLNLIS